MIKSLFTRIFKKSVETSFQNDMNISNEWVISYFDENIQHINFSLYWIVDSSQEIEKIILHVIRKGLIVGLSYNQIGSNIHKETNKIITKEQSKSIAVHILWVVYWWSSYISWLDLVKEWYILEKEWTTCHDDKVCKVCLENESIWLIPFDKTFPSGDNFAPRAQEINCRCTSTYKIIGIK